MIVIFNLIQNEAVDGVSVQDQLMWCIFLGDGDAPDVGASATSLPKSCAMRPAFPSCPGFVADSPKMDACCSASKRETA